MSSWREPRAQILNRFVRAVVLGIILTFSSVLYYREFNWPDYYHIEYGLPAAWLVRTLSTIIGPTDNFTFQPTSFLLDWFFWSLFTLILLSAVSRLRHDFGLNALGLDKPHSCNNPHS